LGKRAVIPEEVVIGRNCTVNSDAKLAPGAVIATGETE
jgi:UDP-3-O-[3-hydroxymyristoyl] glucosamine N-acyltransferase